jgi:hypothetical protein
MTERKYAESFTTATTTDIKYWTLSPTQEKKKMFARLNCQAVTDTNF